MFDIRTVTPPGIALVLSFLLIYSGLSMNRPEMVFAGWVFLAVAILLQVAYLLLRNWKPKVAAGEQIGPISKMLFRLLVSELPDANVAFDE